MSDDARFLAWLAQVKVSDLHITFPTQEGRRNCLGFSSKPLNLLEVLRTLYEGKPIALPPDASA